MTGHVPRAPGVLGLLRRISRLEVVSAAVAAAVFLGLVVADRDVIEAPWQSERAIAVVVGGTILAAVALLVMLRFEVPSVVRVLVLGLPLVLVSYWLISPFFVDSVVREDFETSIAAARRVASVPPTPTASDPPTVATPALQLRGSGKFVGLAGHRGTGDAGVFRLADGSHVLRLENLNLDNGPDLQLYLVPGADRRSPGDRAHAFGALRGNVGEQTYEIPSSYSLSSGPWTVLVWCRAFAVEFVAASFSLE